jgi:hypothetical protein
MPRLTSTGKLAHWLPRSSAGWRATGQYAGGGIEELVDSAAVLVPPGDANEAGSADRRAGWQPRMSRRLREAGLRRAATWPDEDDVADDLARAYTEVARHRRYKGFERLRRVHRAIALHDVSWRPVGTARNHEASLRDRRRRLARQGLTASASAIFWSLAGSGVPCRN